MKVVKKARKFAHKTVTRWLYSSCYVLGLTLIYPYLILGTPSIPTLAIASVFLLAGIIGAQRQERTLAGTFHRLGKTTLIPGTIGVFLLIFGRATLAIFLPEGITPFVDSLITFVVPKTALLTVVYFVVGFTLWFLGKKLR